MVYRLIVLCVLCWTGFAWAAKAHEASGMINSIDQSSREISIAHGPIKTLGMGEMTMSFRVADPAMLEDFTKGQKIDFSVTKDRQGRLIITDIEPVD